MRNALFLLSPLWPRLDLFVNSKWSPAQLIQNSHLFKARTSVWVRVRVSLWLVFVVQHDGGGEAFDAAPMS